MLPLCELVNYLPNSKELLECITVPFHFASPGPCTINMWNELTEINIYSDKKMKSLETIKALHKKN